jgi:23S rRNA (pseudouridine1915-N3)-methyltransferase
MRFRIVAVGKPRHPALADAIRDYEQRAAHYWPLDVREVKDDRLADALSSGATTVACDEGGRSFDSQGFAAWLDGLREAARDVAFLIGPAEGLPAAVKDGADHRLRLAPWTLPHELARLVLAEQLYRAGTILRGEPYHK